jgi:hypothetical protein
MKKPVLLISILFLSCYYLFAQEQLNRIGQTPGGAAHHVNWIEDQQKLIVGCGASLWVYDMSDIENPQVIAKRAFTQLINETDLYGDVLFVAAENSGLYALDFSCSDLSIVDVYRPMIFSTPSTPQDVFDFVRRNDTLFVPVKFDNHASLRIVQFTEAYSFNEICVKKLGLGFPNPARNGARCIAVNDRYIVIGRQASDGELILLDRQTYDEIDSHSDSLINNIQKLRFSDLSDDVFFVCGGSANAGITSYFLACHISDNQIHIVDTFSSVQYVAEIPAVGIPGVNAHHFKNMDSRNDTIFLATTAWADVHNLNLPDEPFSFIPVIDASGLPDTPMEYISFTYGGLWHFDVALMHGTPHLAVASEWAGLLVSDVSSCVDFADNQPLDTLFIKNTGGWAQEVHITGDTLWVAHEGWGLVAYLTDSLLHSIYGYHTNPIILQLYQLLDEGQADRHYFVSDFEFIDDTLLYLTGGHIFNLQNWFSGGTPELIKQDSLSPYNFYMSKIHSDNGSRLVIGSGVWPIFGPLKLYVYNPYTEEFLHEKVLNGESAAIHVDDDILFYSYRTTPYLSTGGQVYLVAAKIVDDELIIIEEMLINDIPVIIPNTEQINTIAYENGTIAIGVGKEFRWYEWTGTEFSYINSIYSDPLDMLGQISSGASIKNNLLYSVYKKYGLKIIDLSDGTEVAYYEGIGGHDEIDGFNVVEIGNDGKIYLSDFYQGVYVIEAYDLTLVNIEEPENLKINNELFSLYPNPAKDYFQIEFTDNLNNISLKIYDLTGRELYYEKINNRNSITINSETWRAGLYFVSIVDGNRIVKSERFMIYK